MTTSGTPDPTDPTDPVALSTADLRGGLDGERGDLLEALRQRRGFLRHTLSGLSDDQARETPTASALCVGGLVKHVMLTEQGWARFALEGPGAMPDIDFASVDWSDPPAEVLAMQQQFQVLPEESVAGLLADYAAVAAVTDELIATADLDRVWPLPAAPWFAPGAAWSVRRVVHQLIGETAQHAGHADIIRETIDGQTTMAGG